jgi:hypothetical protein
MRAMAMMSAITPMVIPRMEIKVITEIKACFLLAVKYLLAIKNS